MSETATDLARQLAQQRGRRVPRTISRTAVAKGAPGASAMPATRRAAASWCGSSGRTAARAPRALDRLRHGRARRPAGPDRPQPGVSTTFAMSLEEARRFLSLPEFVLSSPPISRRLRQGRPRPRAGCSRPARPIRGTIAETYLSKRGIVDVRGIKGAQIPPDSVSTGAREDASRESWPARPAAVTDVQGRRQRRAAHLGRTRWLRTRRQSPRRAGRWVICLATACGTVP